MSTHTHSHTHCCTPALPLFGRGGFQGNVSQVDKVVAGSIPLLLFPPASTMAQPSIRRNSEGVETKGYSFKGEVRFFRSEEQGVMKSAKYIPFSPPCHLSVSLSSILPCPHPGHMINETSHCWPPVPDTFSMFSGNYFLSS